MVDKKWWGKAEGGRREFLNGIETEENESQWFIGEQRCFHATIPDMINVGGSSKKLELPTIQDRILLEGYWGNFFSR